MAGANVVDEPRHPALEWARSGALALTGPTDGPPVLPPVPIASRAREVAEQLASLAGEGFPPLDGPALLGERAAIAGYTRAGSVSPSGSCRLLRAADGWVALNLARPEDVNLLPAWLESPREGDDPFEIAAAAIRDRTSADLVSRGRTLGLPVSEAVAPSRIPPPWMRVVCRGRRARRSGRRTPLVVDLSSLWAGPLCTSLLARAGARVVKVESERRPDGARQGPARFFDLLNAGKESVAVDFTTNEGRAALRGLIDAADVVVEGSRPRALRQLGIDAEQFVLERPGRTWLGITGYGRKEPEAGWVAFGDDAAVAAGLAVATGGREAPLFCGDAIADPLAGLHGALAVLVSWLRGGGRLIDLSLRDVVASAMGERREERRRAFVEPNRQGGFDVVVGRRREAVQPPRARHVTDRAAALGADTGRVLRELGIPC